MTADSFVRTTLKNICSLGAISARASVNDVQVAQGTIAPHKEPVATVLIMYLTGCGGISPTTFGHSVDSKYETGTRVSGLESILATVRSLHTAPFILSLLLFFLILSILSIL